MKALNFEQMENIQGGVSCFFAIPWVVCTTGLIPYMLGWSQPAGAFLHYCWNS